MPLPAMIPISLLIFAILASTIWMFLREHLKSVSRPDYLPPVCSTGYRLLNWAGNRSVSLLAGKIETRGTKLADIPKPALITANHPHFLDPFVIARVLRSRPKYMVHPGVYRSAWGLGAFCLSSASIVASQGAVESAVKILKRQEHFVIFPEGYTNMDSELLTFRTGAVRIIRTANDHGLPPVPIFPLSLNYKRYPDKWILKFQPPLQYLILLLLFWRYRGGVRVTIGNPIYPHQLPAGVREASDFLQDYINGMLPDRDSAGTAVKAANAKSR